MIFHLMAKSPSPYLRSLHYIYDIRNIVIGSSTRTNECRLLRVLRPRINCEFWVFIGWIGGNNCVCIKRFF